MTDPAMLHPTDVEGSDNTVRMMGLSVFRDQKEELLLPAGMKLM